MASKTDSGYRRTCPWIGKIAMLMLLVCVVSYSAQAAQITVTWTGGGDGLSWSDPANWNPGVVPDNNGDTYRVIIGPGALVELTSERTIDYLSIDAAAELDLRGFFRHLEVLGDLVLNGTMRLGSVRFPGGPHTLSGGGEFVFSFNAPTGGIRAPTLGDSLAISLGSTIRMSGGPGEIDLQLINSGILELSATSVIANLPIVNTGEIRVTGGEFQLASITADNTGGLISADGGRLLIGPEDPNGSPVRVTGGTLERTNASLQAALEKGLPKGLFFTGAKLTDVTLIGDTTSLADFDLALESSLVNRGTLSIERFDGFSVLRVDNSDVTPFRLSGGGTIDFGDGSVVSNMANQRMRFEAENLSNVDNTLLGNVVIRNQSGQAIDFVNEGLMIASDAIGMEVGIGSFTNRGTVQIDAGGHFSASAIRNEGTLVGLGKLEASQLIQAAGTASVAGEFLGSIVLEGGALEYDSADAIDNLTLSGSTFPVGGGGIGATNVDFTFGMGPSASIAFELGGLVGELEHDRLNTNNGGLGSTTYDGTLIIRTANNFSPLPGDVFTVARFLGSRFGEFAQVVNQTPFPGLNFDVEYTGDFFNFVRVHVSGDPTIVVEGDLAVELHQCNRISGPGRTHDYAVVVRNDGPDPASNVQLTIALPSNATLNPGVILPADCTLGTADILCQYPALAVDEIRAVPLAFDIDPGATASTGITASVAAQEADPAPGNNQASIGTTLVDDLVGVDGFESCDG